jgi:cysteine-rich repeat protein
VVVCGDGFIDGFEQCDDGNTANTDNCVDLFGVQGCGFAFCGDGYLLSNPTPPSVAEECDDGNFVNGDGCADDCTVEP